MGVVLAFWGAHALAAFLSDNWASPLELDIRPDARVLAFTVGMTTLVGIALGILPALRGTGVEVVPALKKHEGNGSAISGAFRGRFRLGHSLVVGQVALSVLVLVVASLCPERGEPHRIDPGFDTRQVLLFEIDPTLSRIHGSQYSRFVSRSPGADSWRSQVWFLPATHENALLNGGLHKGTFTLRDSRKSRRKSCPLGPGFSKPCESRFWLVALWFSQTQARRGRWRS